MIAVILLLGAAGDLSLDGEAGYSGVFFSSSWNRVTADLANRGDAVEGVLELVVQSRTSETLTYQRRISLASGARQRIPIDLFLTGLETQMDLSVVNARGAVRARIPLRFSFANSRERRLVEVGSLGAAMSPAPDQLGAVSVRTTPERLPDDFRLLLAADAILMTEPFRLEPEQESAVRTWIELGGRLIFASGTKVTALSEGFWRELCPLTQPRSEQVDVLAGETEVSLPLVTGVRTSGTPVYSLAGRPAVYRAPLGRGEVVFLAFPLDRARIEEAVPPGPLWRSVFALPAVKEEDPTGKGEELHFDFADTDALLSGLFGSPSALGLRTAGGGLLILGLYVLLIGPLDFFRLRRRGALRRGWISYSGIVAGFTVLSITWTVFLQPHPTLLHHLVLADPQMVQVFSSLRAGPSGVYDLEAKGLLSPVPLFYSFGASPMPQEFRVEASSRVSLPAPALTSRAFVSCRGAERAEFGVTCAWTDRGSFQLLVKNDSALELGPCLLVSRDQVFPVGALHAGEHRAWSLDPTASLPFGQWAEKLNVAVAFNWRVGIHRRFGDLDPALQPLFLSFYRFIHRSGSNVTRDRSYLSQRGIDLSAELEAGHWIFVGSFQRDLSGLRVPDANEIRVRGLVRARVAEVAP